MTQEIINTTLARIATAPIDHLGECGEWGEWRWYRFDRRKRVIISDYDVYVQHRKWFWWDDVSDISDRGFALALWRAIGRRLEEDKKCKFWTAISSIVPDGNLAFEEYKAEMLHRLDREQQEFTNFRQRLRRLKDKAEFDQFTADHAPQSGIMA